jgi:anti-sigma regulatory factor (Ser/Thr protein kinase)
VPRILSQRWPATAESVPAARHATIDALTRTGVGNRQVLAAIALAVSEAVGNAVRHAYPATAGDIELAVEHDPGEITITVIDTGVGITDRTRNPGLGLGLQLMDALTKRCTIDSHTAGTTITLAFDCEPSRPSPEHTPHVHGHPEPPN